MTSEKDTIEKRLRDLDNELGDEGDSALYRILDLENELVKERAAFASLQDDYERLKEKCDEWKIKFENLNSQSSAPINDLSHDAIAEQSYQEVVTERDDLRAEVEDLRAYVGQLTDYLNDGEKQRVSLRTDRDEWKARFESLHIQVPDWESLDAECKQLCAHISRFFKGYAEVLKERDEIKAVRDEFRKLFAVTEEKRVALRKERDEAVGIAAQYMQEIAELRKENSTLVDPLNDCEKERESLSKVVDYFTEEHNALAASYEDLRQRREYAEGDYMRQIAELRKERDELKATVERVREWAGQWASDTRAEILNLLNPPAPKKREPRTWHIPVDHEGYIVADAGRVSKYIKVVEVLESENE